MKSIAHTLIRHQVKIYGKVYNGNSIYLSLTFWVGLFMGYKVGLLEGDSVGGLSTVMASEHESII